jgi:hypothetical protein
MATLPDSSGDTGQEDFPRTWRFDEDGLEVKGHYVRLDEGHTQNGPCPIVVLNVDGEHRSVWAFHAALRNRLADEVGRRSDGDLTQGERVVIRQGEVKQGASGYSYRSYVVRFPDAPKRSPKDILGPLPSDDDRTGDDDDAPF